MKRAVIAAAAAAGIGIAVGACGGSPAHPGEASHAGTACKTEGGINRVQPGHVTAQGHCVPNRPPAESKPSGGGGVTGTWTIASCQVDVTYINDTNTADDYVPDTDANFQKYFVPNQASGAASIAVVVTFVNNTGGPASLPTGLVVSFIGQSGNFVGNPQSFNGPYGSAVTNGRGSGEAFSSSTLFNPGQTVAESPDIGASVPRQPDLSCSVSSH